MRWMSQMDSGVVVGMVANKIIFFFFPFSPFSLIPLTNWQSSTSWGCCPTSSPRSTSASRTMSQQMAQHHLSKQLHLHLDQTRSATTLTHTHHCHQWRWMIRWMQWLSAVGSNYAWQRLASINLHHVLFRGFVFQYTSVWLLWNAAGPMCSQQYELLNPPTGGQREVFALSLNHSH